MPWVATSWNGDGVDRHLRLGHRPRLRATADHDHTLLELDRQLDIEGDRGPGADLHAAADCFLEAGQGEREVVGAGPYGEREHAAAIGDGGSRLTTCRVARLHGHARQDETRRVGDRAGDCRVLGDSGHGCRERAQDQTDPLNPAVQSVHAPLLFHADPCLHYHHPYLAANRVAVGARAELDRHRRFGHRSRLRAGADDDHPFFEADLHLHVEHGDGACPPVQSLHFLHFVPHRSGPAGQAAFRRGPDTTNVVVVSGGHLSRPTRS